MARGILDPRYQQVIAVLVEARHTNGITQASLAHQLRMPQQFVSRYEHSQRRLDIIEYIDVASTLGLDAIHELAKVVQNSRAE